MENSDVNNNNTAETEEVVTVKDYLIGLAHGYPVEEETLKVIGVKTGMALDTDVATLSVKGRDMLEIEMLRFLLRAPFMSQSIADANGNWSHKEGAVEMNSNDKKYLQMRLKELEQMYGIRKSSIKMHNYGIKQWH